MNDCESNSAEAVSGTDSEPEKAISPSPSPSEDSRPGESLSPGVYWQVPGTEDRSTGPTERLDICEKRMLRLLEEIETSSDNVNGPVSPGTPKEVQSPKPLKRTNFSKTKPKGKATAKVAENGPINTANKLDSSDIQV